MIKDDKISEIETFDFNTSLDIGWFISDNWLWETPCNISKINVNSILKTLKIIFYIFYMMTVPMKYQRSENLTKNNTRAII